MNNKKIYIISNSHMDPIWLWRLREGRSTWLNTVRTTVKLLQRHPYLKFCRSSSASYEWIEKSDPLLFEEIRRLVAEGRWEIVGGWIEQSDTIITPGEVLLRQAQQGQAYFKEKFQKTATIGYSVDSFGQNVGLPQILNLSGMKRYVFMRPMDHEKKMPHQFRWRYGKNEVTAYRIRHAYTTIPQQSEQAFIDWLDKCIDGPEENHAFFFGVGDHGGGIYEEQLEWLQNAAKTRNMEFSTLEHFFDIIEQTDLPIYSGECTHHSPGCYSVASDIKKQAAKAEDSLLKAEKIILEQNDKDAAADMSRLNNAWNQYLLNYFHDVYSGTCIKPAYDNEIRNLSGFATWVADEILERRLSRYASQIKTDFLSEGGVLLWNPLPCPVRATVALNTWGDPNHHGAPFNIIRDEKGNEYPIQWTQGSCSFMKQCNIIMDVPASGLQSLAYGYNASMKKKPLGFTRQKSILERVSLTVLADQGDTWGHDLKRLGKAIGAPKLIATEEKENGPLLSTLRMTYKWRQSIIKLDITAFAKIKEIQVKLHSTWLNPNQTLKLCWNTRIQNGRIATGQAASILHRKSDNCEQPFIGFAGATDKAGNFSGFIAADMHSYDSIGVNKLRLTLLRCIPFCQHNPNPPHGDEGFSDYGQLEQIFWIADNVPVTDLPQMAMSRIRHVEHLEITNGPNGSSLKRDEYTLIGEGILSLAQNLNEFHLWNSSKSKQNFQILKNKKLLIQGSLRPGQLKLLPLQNHPLSNQSFL